jgi:acyl-CoA reductase-like NAD-dependent aldehyde dehydrogenase
MSEIELRAEDLTKLLAKLNDEAAAVGTMKPEQRADAVAAVKERMEKAKREYKMVEMESRVLSGDAKTIWKNKLKEFQKQMNSIESELKWAGATSPDGKTGHKTSVADTEEGMSAYGRQ